MITYNNLQLSVPWNILEAIPKNVVKADGIPV